MAEPDDYQLLNRFALENSEVAFAALVQRHVHLVHSVAWRQTSDAHAAEEITQAVFIILARKAGSLGGQISLAGWLHQTARLTAANYRRTEIRRAQREQEAFMQSQLDEVQPDTDAAWRQVAPLLDDALGQLRARDRHALVLRFFEGKALAEVGVALGASEEAAKMRVNRALEKLRKIFSKRGVTLSATAIAGAVINNSVQAAPVGLAKTISVVALAKGAAASGSNLTLVKGVLKLMAWTKMKLAVVVGASVLLVAGTATVAVKEIQRQKIYPWQVLQPFGVFYKQDACVKIVPTRFPAGNGNMCSDSDIGALGIAMPLKVIIETAYHKDAKRTVVECALPSEKFDFIAKLVGPPEPHKSPLINTNWTVELQKEIAGQFGVTGRMEKRDADVLVLKPVASGILGFKPGGKIPDATVLRMNPGGKMPNVTVVGFKAGKLSYNDQPISTLVRELENRFKIPVVNRSGLTNRYDYKLTWDESDVKHPNNPDFIRSLRDQLGLELVPARERIEMLVVDKVK